MMSREILTYDTRTCIAGFSLNVLWLVTPLRFYFLHIVSAVLYIYICQTYRSTANRTQSHIVCIDLKIVIRSKIMYILKNDSSSDQYRVLRLYDTRILRVYDWRTNREIKLSDSLKFHSINRVTILKIVYMYMWYDNLRSNKTWVSTISSRAKVVGWIFKRNPK